MTEAVTMKKAVFWTAIAKYSTAVLGLFFGMLLSRILTPTQYGTVAVISVFVVFFQLFADMGFGVSVIQNQELTDNQINDIFSWTVYIGFFLQLLFVGILFPISQFYNDTIYIPLGSILSFALLFNSINAIPNAMMLKGKRFKAIAVRSFVACLVTSIITLIMALKGFGVYALVLSSVLSAVIVFVWNKASVNLKFTFRPKIASIRRIWGYSIYQFLAQMLNYFNRNLDTMIIGKFYTQAELGQYNKSYNLMMMPIAYIPGVVGPALHPILAEHQNDPLYIYQSYLRILKILSLIGCFLSAVLFYTADELVIILFGNQWYPACLPFKILALSVWAQLATNTFGPIYLSIGNTKLLFRSVICSCCIIITGIISGCIAGSIFTVAMGVSIAYVVNYFVSYFILSKFAFGRSFWLFLKTFRHEFLIFCILVCVALIPINFNNIYVLFIVKIFIMLLVYATLLYMFKEHKLLLSLLRRKKIF